MNLEQLPSGRVLLRDGKQKLRIFFPKQLFTCELCGNELGKKAVKWETGGNITIVAMCFLCAIIEIKNFKKDSK